MDKNNEKFWVELGNLLKDERIAKRITQQELADKVGCTRNCIANWETGRRTIDIVDLCKICSVMNLDVNEIIEKVSKYVH